MGPVEFDYAQVQHEACPYCPHHVALVPKADLASALIDASRRWHDFLTTVLDHPGGDVDLRVRPQPDVWSAIEYACHVRDGLSWAARHAEQALLADAPDHPEWDHEAAAAHDHYVEQDAQAVAEDIVVAAAELAALVLRLDPIALARTSRRNGVVFTVGGLVRYGLHEALHHLRDARVVVPTAAR